jgi:uncharacterized iron-regulated membrane protein
MSIATRAKRLSFLIHRWTGVGACVLMALWFVSGIVMLFVGYPKLTPWERLAALPALASESCCVPVDVALALGDSAAHVHQIALTSIQGHPHYRLHQHQGGYVVIDAVSGKLAAPVDRNAALAGASAFKPHTDASYLGRITEDRWTHARALDAHRPLHQVQMNDADHTLLYVSSTTGQVVMDAPRAQRAWNYVGAWLHWLYMFRDRPVDPAWSWLVIILSAFGTITAISGTLVGIWRWRFSKPYKSGSRTPYRENILRWHHISGLLFAGFICTWIFSGLMSMNPLGIFDAKGARPDVSAYRGAPIATKHLSIKPSQALALLKAEGFQAVELEWRVLDDQPYLLARNAVAATRLIVQQDKKFIVRDLWTDAELLHAATRLLPASIASHQKLAQYDNYYYVRQPEAMMGASERRLPILRVQFADTHNTWSYLDPYTGDVALSMDSAQRSGRWLFSFLHSWDLPAILKTGVWRDAVLILLSLGGFALSLTGVVIGYKRMRKWLAKLSRALF